jgi:hypothetical protein
MKVFSRFNKTAAATGIFCLAAFLDLSAEGISSERIVELRELTQQRRQEFFRRDAGKPLRREPIDKDWNNRGDFTRHYAQSIVLFAMRAFQLNEQLDEANDALQELCRYHLDRPQTFFEIHSFPSVCDTLARLYIFYGPNGTKKRGLLTPETAAILEKIMWEWANEKADIKDADFRESQTWWIDDSENHHAQYFTTCWAFSQILKSVPGYQDKRFKDGHTPSEHYAAWTKYLKEYIRQRVCKGMLIEIESPSYSSATLKSMVAFYDFTEDPVLKRRAGNFLTLYWILWAETQIDAVEGGGKTRVYAKAATRSSGFIRSAAWYLTGEGEPDFFHVNMLPFVTSTWRVPDVVFQVAYGWPEFAPYQIRQRRMGLAVSGYEKPPHYRMKTDFGGILRYTYVTPDFIMGTLMLEARPTADWSAISSQNRWDGVIFAGDRDARIYPAPYNAKGASILNGLWSVQSKGAMVSQQIPSQKRTNLVPGEGATESWRVFFSSAGLSQPRRDGRWIFVEAPQAYAGVCVVEGGAEFLPPERFGSWLKCDDANTPVIIEVARKTDFKSFDAFCKKLSEQELAFKNSVLSYRSLAGDLLTFPADRSRLPEINDTPVDLAPAKVLDSPFVQSQWDSGVAHIQFGELRSILDFNKE